MIYTYFCVWDVDLTPQITEYIKDQQYVLQYDIYLLLLLGCSPLISNH